MTRNRPGGRPLPRRLFFGFAASAAQSRGENPGSRITLRDDDFFKDTCVGARVLLLRRLPLLGGPRPRWEAAADGGGPRELPLSRGGWSVLVGVRRFAWFAGRGRGGGGIREEAPVVVAFGGIEDGCGFGGGARDGCGGGLIFGSSWSRFVEDTCSVVPFMVCEMDGIVAGCDVSLSPLSRLNVGTAEMGVGTLKAEALGVFCESSSSVSIDGVEVREPCFRCTGSFAVAAATGAPGLGSGEEERGSAQLLGG